jgi:prepilin-type N-terminal cleavage/methylation domain-containing protein
LETREHGFTLVEFAIVLVLIGIMFAMGIPAYRSYAQTFELRGTVQAIATQMRLARERAIGSGIDQTCSFYNDPTGLDSYRVIPGGTGTAIWTLPRDLTFTHAAGSTASVMFLKDGRAQASAQITLANRRGLADTVSVMTSGLVVTN